MSMETMQQRIQVSGILKGHGYCMKVRICATKMFSTHYYLNFLLLVAVLRSQWCVETRLYDCIRVPQ